MNKQLAVCMAMVALASSAMAVVTNTFQIGGEGSDSGWDDNVVTNVVGATTNYSVTFGVPQRYAESEISNLTFTVTFDEITEIPVYISNNWLGAGATTNSGPDRRINSNEVLRLKVTYDDPSGKLTNLRLSGFGTYWNTQPYETTVFSDGVNNFPMTDTDNDFIQDYNTTGLTQLSMNNVDTWSMLVSVDDYLSDGTNFTESALGAFVVEYVADIDYVSSYIPLNPAFFKFDDGTEFDNKGIGVTMTRSNSWDSPITITSVDIIGMDGTHATNGVGNKTNIQNVNALGVNSANFSNSEVSNDTRDFNPNEGWVISFGTNVYLDEIDLASVSTDTVMTVSSTAFSDIVLSGVGDNNGDFSLSNTYVPTGASVTFQMTSTTNASDDSLRISSLSVQSVVDANSYQAWIQDENMTSELNDGYGDDPDVDTMNNLMEFALGGDPLVDDAAIYLPTYEAAPDGGIDYLNYIYRRRILYDVSGLTYAVGSTLNLVLEPATNITEEVGSGAIDAEFESVTNRVSTDVEAQQFMQLEVTID